MPLGGELTLITGVGKAGFTSGKAHSWSLVHNTFGEHPSGVLYAKRVRPTAPSFRGFTALILPMLLFEKWNIETPD